MNWEIALGNSGAESWEPEMEVREESWAVKAKSIGFHIPVVGISEVTVHRWRDEPCLKNWCPGFPRSKFRDFRGCWMSLASEGAVALSSGSYPTATRSFFYSSQGFSPSASTQPFFLFFLPQKAWLCNWLIIHFHNYAATTTVQFRTVPAPWSFSSRSFVLNPCSQQPLGNHWFAFQSHSISSLQKFHVNGIKQWVVFCVWLLSLSVLVFRFIHVCRAFVASSSVLA